MWSSKKLRRMAVITSSESRTVASWTYQLALKGLHPVPKQGTDLWPRSLEKSKTRWGGITYNRTLSNRWMLYWVHRWDMMTDTYSPSMFSGTPGRRIVVGERKNLKSWIAYRPCYMWSSMTLPVSDGQLEWNSMKEWFYPWCSRWPIREWFK